jgi:hypothetical protein
MDPRLDELLKRLCAPGEKCAHVSASECHEIVDEVTLMAKQLQAFKEENADLLARLPDATARHEAIKLERPPAIEIKDNDKVVLRLHYNGTVEFGEGILVDDAALQFWEKLLGHVQSHAASQALDQIAKLCGVPEWQYPGQVVRDVQHLKAAMVSIEDRNQELLAEAAARADETGFDWKVIVYDLGGDEESIAVHAGGVEVGRYCVVENVHKERLGVEKTIRACVSAAMKKMLKGA